MRAGISVFREGVRTARTVRPSALYLSFLGMAIPLAVFRLVSARWSATKVNEIRSLDLTAGQALPLFQAVGDYASSYLGSALVCGICVGLAYFAAIESFAAGFGKSTNDEPLRRLPRYFTRLLVSAPLIFIALTMLTMMGQVLPFAAVMISILWLMAPVLMLLEGKSTLRSLRDSLFIRYAPAGGGRRQFAFFRLMSLGFAVYAVMMGVLILGEDFLRLDEIAPIARSVWMGVVPGFELPLGFTLYGLLSSLLEAACLMSLALFTVSLYVAARRSAEHA